MMRSEGAFYCTVSVATKLEPTFTEIAHSVNQLCVKSTILIIHQSSANGLMGMSNAMMSTNTQQMKKKYTCKQTSIINHEIMPDSWCNPKRNQMHPQAEIFCGGNCSKRQGRDGSHEVYYLNPDKKSCFDLQFRVLHTGFHTETQEGCIDAKWWTQRIFVVMVCSVSECWQRFK